AASHPRMRSRCTGREVIAASYGSALARRAGRSPSTAAATQAIHYGYGRIFIGATPGQFRLIELSYQETAGAALTVVPGPGALAVMAGAAILGRGRRRR
ncbi:MAG: hypothetical protein ACKOGJ_11290, partial [Phycisphaerales bacterium]